MPTDLQLYIEPMNSFELSFLRKLAAAERKLFIKVYALLMTMALFISFGGSFLRDEKKVEKGFSTTDFLCTGSILCSIITFSIVLTWYLFARKLQLDIRNKTKTIEKRHINRKLYLKNDKACYCFIDSKIKLSIEVAYEDFIKIKTGDEINIEYATNSKLYLGYF